MKNTVMIIVLQTVLVVSVMGGTWYFTQTAAPSAEQSEPAPNKSQKKLFMSMQPSFLVNLEDGKAVRFLQIELDLMAYDPEVFERVTSYNSRIRNDLIMLFSSLNRESINGPEARADIQARALATANRVLSEESGKEGVEALYFTKFVMQ